MKKIQIPKLSSFAEKKFDDEMPMEVIVEEVHRYREEKRTAKQIDALLTSLEKTEERIRRFQTRYGAQLPGEAANLSPLDRVEWEGEMLTLEKLKEKIKVSRGGK